SEVVENGDDEGGEDHEAKDDRAVVGGATPQIGILETTDGEPTEVEGEDPQHDDPEPGIENGLKKHTSHHQRLLGLGTPPPGDDLPGLETEPEREQGGTEEEDQGPW